MFRILKFLRPKKIFRAIKTTATLAVFAFVAEACAEYMNGSEDIVNTIESAASTESSEFFKYVQDFTESIEDATIVDSLDEQAEETNTEEVISSEEIPTYSGESSIDINGGTPFFTEEEIVSESFESYGDLDSLGRCTIATACLSKDTMPAEGEKRGEIGMIKPAGWHTVKYDCIEDLYLYNRCHLIGWQLGAENANEKNLITGTRYMNLEMTDTENMVAKYIRNTGNHVMYRVTPIFTGDNLICDGLLIEAKSVEDEEVSVCKFYYNVQPGVVIDYKTGESEEE